MELALFDLDHTLIPFDSGSVFTRFLASRGALPESFEAEYQDYCMRYAAGNVDMVQMHRFTVGALGVHAPAALAQWLAEFTQSISPRIPADSIALVRRHREAGCRCALVTATTRFVAEPFARLLGLSEMLATEPAVDAAGHYTGEIVGVPCFRADKLTHVNAWLAREGAHWRDVRRSWFYSDSAHDLALLQAVTDPVAVNPDPRLKAHAEAAGWPVQTLG